MSAWYYICSFVLFCLAWVFTGRWWVGMIVVAAYISIIRYMHGMTTCAVGNLIC